MIRVGMAGTRKGMSTLQVPMFTKLLRALNPNLGAHFHHGDCVGSDLFGHDIAKGLGYKIYIHPPIKNEYRAFCEGDVILPPADYLVRNRDIVDCVDRVIGTPIGPEQQQGSSGTWATLRYAFKMQKPTMIIFPNGHLEPFGDWSKYT